MTSQMLMSDLENVPLTGTSEARHQQRPLARLAAVGVCVLAAAALVTLGASRHFATPSRGGVRGVSLAVAAETKNHVEGILDDIYKKRNETVASLKEALAKENWTATAAHAHQYDRFSEHATVVQEWQEKVMKVYDALGDGAYEQSDLLLEEAVLIQCMASNKERAIDLEHKLAEEVDLNNADGVERADLLILLLEKMQDECVKSVDGEETQPADDSYLPGGTLSFEAGGSKADVEQAVSVILAKHLGLEPSQVVATATEGRRLAAGTAGDSGVAPKSWEVGFKVAAPDAGASPEQVAAAQEEMKAKVTALAEEQTALVDQLCFVLPDAKKDSFKVALPAPGPVTGRMTFTCASGSADVEQGVGEALAQLLEVDSSQLALEVVGARRLKAAPEAEVPTTTPAAPAATTEGAEEAGEPKYMPLPWVVTFTVTLPDLDAYKKVIATVGGIKEAPSDLIKKLSEALTTLEPQTLQVDLAGETLIAGIFTTTSFAQPDPALVNCSGVTDSCLETRCCKDEGRFCYGKNEWFAGCRLECNVGIHEHDHPDHKTPWSCEVLDSNPAAPAPIQAPAPPTECAGQYQDCSSAKCCSQAGEFCYKKDAGWAQCMPTCTKGLSPDDKEPWKTPWSCEPIDVNEGQPAPIEEDGSVDTTEEATDAVATTS